MSTFRRAPIPPAPLIDASKASRPESPVASTKVLCGAAGVACGWAMKGGGGGGAAAVFCTGIGGGGGGTAAVFCTGIGGGGGGDATLFVAAGKLLNVVGGVGGGGGD